MFNLKSSHLRSKSSIIGLTLVAILILSLNLFGNVAAPTKASAASLMDNSACMALFQDYTDWTATGLTLYTRQVVYFKMTDSNDQSQTVTYTEGILRYSFTLGLPNAYGRGTQYSNDNRFAYNGLNDNPFDPSITNLIGVDLIPQNGQVYLYNVTKKHDGGSLTHPTCLNDLFYGNYVAPDGATHIVVITAKKGVEIYASPDAYTDPSK